MLKIAITGATGFLGRNLLFEILKKNLSRLDQLEIFILGRSASDGTPLATRIAEVLRQDGVEYMDIPEANRKSFLRSMSRVIRCIEHDLENDAPPDLEHIDWFFHVASLTDLKSSPATAAALRRVNVEGTRKILDLVARIHVREFCYVGTAYVCGEAEGFVPPDALDRARRFRNPYEQTKCEAEMLVREFAAKTGIRCRYFRPSTVSGRLLEPPYGAVCNFDCFYAWAAFFFRLNLQRALHADSADVRVCYSRDSGLNIVPVDYVAKAMYLICEKDHPGESYHLVNCSETPHDFYVPRMLDSLGIRWVTHTDCIPAARTKWESLYYRSVGAVYTPYVTSKPMSFDTSNIAPFLNRHGLECPAMDDGSIGVLMDYARRSSFGLAA